MKPKYCLLILAVLAVLMPGCARKQAQGVMSPEELALRNRLAQSPAGYTAPEEQEQNTMASTYYKPGGRPSKKSYIK